jgi:hypothetical protein
MAKKHGRPRRRRVALGQVERRMQQYMMEFNTVDKLSPTWEHDKAYWMEKYVACAEERETLLKRLEMS